jgi:hypothetical protein
MPFLEASGSTNPEQYVEASYTQAQQEAVPRFVEKLTAQLGMGDSGFPNLVRISLFQNEYSGAGIEGLTFPNGILNTVNLIHSFSLAGVDATTTAPAVTSSGAFLPGYWAQFYGSTTHLIIAGQGQRIDAQSEFTVGSTNFLSFAISGATATPEAIGMVDGYLINNYAIDVLDDHVRAGVSINHQWFFLTDPMPMMEGDPAATDGTTTTTMPAQSGNSTTENYIVILTLPGANGAEAGVMQETGRLHLGKPNELFTALRFYDNVAYAVTFERKDPLYVLDLSDPTAPRVASELSDLGFSSYLHSLNADHTLMLGIGQAALANGTVTGTKLSVYNMIDPLNPFVATEYVFQNTETMSAYTSAEYDPKSLRVVPTMSLVSLPFNVYNYQSGYQFNGFWTFFVNETTIAKECELGYTFNTSTNYVEPTPVEGDGSAGDSGGGSSGGGSDATPADTMPCFYCANMSPRSMVFDGALMTVNNRFVRSYALDTCAQAWALDIVVPVDNTTSYGCCGGYY